MRVKRTEKQTSNKKSLLVDKEQRLIFVPCHTHFISRDLTISLS